MSLYVVCIEIEVYMHAAYSPSLTTCLALKIFSITLHKYIKRNKKNNILFNYVVSFRYLLNFFTKNKNVYRCCAKPESEPKDFYNTFGESSNNGYDDNDMITENLALETENERRHRLDSFYSATSAKSTYFSTGSASSYHSMEDDNSTEIGMY